MISWLQSPSTVILEPQKIKSATVSPSICHEVMGPDMQVRKQQLELVMEQQTGSKQEKEYTKAVYCQPAYLTSMQSTS